MNNVKDIQNSTALYKFAISYLKNFAILPSKLEVSVFLFKPLENEIHSEHRHISYKAMCKQQVYTISKHYLYFWSCNGRKIGRGNISRRLFGIYNRRTSK